MIIDPDGLFNGDRLRRCSNMARLYWPYFLLASNGYGRLEINYHRLIARAFASFEPVPNEPELMRYIKEYQEAHLLFLYESQGQLWGQWDCPKKLLNKYNTAADKASPEPPADVFEQWRKSYQEQKKAVPRLPQNLAQLFGNIPSTLPENSQKVLASIPEDLPLGVGVGVGEGDGKEREWAAPENFEQIVDEIGHEHPAASHLQGKALPENWKYAIAEAIKRDGVDSVRAGTRNYRDAVSRWPKSDLRFVMDPFKFYGPQAVYGKDPATFEKGTTTHDTGKLTRQQATAAKFESTDRLSILD